MNANLTIGERLKDLRIERGLTLEQLEQETGISHSSLGKYESDDVKDISPFNLAKLAKYYDVSMDYLMRLTEQRRHPDMVIESLHIDDRMITLLQSGRINNRLLCEMAQHEGFIRFMVDAEVFVDQIGAMHIAQMNDVLEYARNKVMESFDVNDDDLYMRTLELAQVDCHKFFIEAVHNDIDIILNDIRETHKDDMMSGSPSSMAAHLDAAYENAADNLPGTWEQAAYMFCAEIGVDYGRLDNGQKKSLISILKKSDMLQNTINQRGRN